MKETNKRKVIMLGHKRIPSRAKLVYIEVFDRIDKPTMTGKMVYPIVDKFVVQWEEQKKVYPKAVNLGSIF